MFNFFEEPPDYFQKKNFTSLPFHLQLEMQGWRVPVSPLPHQHLLPVFITLILMAVKWHLIAFGLCCPNGFPTEKTQFHRHITYLFMYFGPLLLLLLSHFSRV